MKNSVKSRGKYPLLPQLWKELSIQEETNKEWKEKI